MSNSSESAHDIIIESMVNTSALNTQTINAVNQLYATARPVKSVVDPQCRNEPNISVDIQDMLEHRLKFQNYMSFFGLDDFDSYYTLELNLLLVDMISRGLSSTDTVRHYGVLKRDRYERMMMSSRSEPTMREMKDYSIMKRFEHEEEEENIDLVYLQNESCFKLNFEGEEVIYLNIQGDKFPRHILLTKHSFDLIKRLVDTLVDEYQKEEREKRITRKQIMVYSNSRRGPNPPPNMNMMGMGYGFGPMGMNEQSNWRLVEPIRARSFESVYLNKKNKKELLGSLEEFMSPETIEWYRFHDIPSKRSYLFYGPPGTGKTSTVKAIAGRYDMKLYILKLNLHEMDDMMVGDLIRELPPRSILLIEDIDSIFDRNGERGDMRGGLTFSGLLNMLDGITSFNQQIVIMTTNNREAINRESLRTGRIDLELEFGYMDGDQAKSMIRSFYPDVDDSKVEEITSKVVEYRRVTPVELQEVIIRCRRYDFEYLSSHFEEIMSSVRNGRITQRDRVESYMM